MKKIFTLSALITIAFSANAQQEVKFGPKAGVNFSTLTDVDNSKMLTGFYIGAVAEIKFNDKFSVQPELMYSTQGTKFDSSVTYMGVTIANKGHQKLDYINIPILAKYYIVNGFSVEAGPQFGFLVKAEDKSQNKKTDIKNDVNSFDFGIGAGIAYDLSNGFFANARYNLGLTKLGKNSAQDSKNSVIQVGVGYKF